MKELQSYVFDRGKWNMLEIMSTWPFYFKRGSSWYTMPMVIKQNMKMGEIFDTFLVIMHKD